MPTLTPEAQFTTVLVRLARLYRLGIDEALTGLGLSDALALPIVLLGRRPEGLRQNALAEELGVEGPSLVRLLDRLVEDGLVERREDPADRRAKTVHLTAEGHSHSLKAAAALDAYRAQLMEGVSGAEIETCLKVFDLMLTRLLATRREHRP